ncbi:uncharacterized protein Dwil_GK16268 [Drosophila willistoni]|uniref:Uncharacterized protein n=1 Tax=Drosophila willistoni TaxID=7260 RepID=B4N1M7_DROWI|nr:uncharacterized protein LOC6644870 [Drosophila willistoni]EDW78266.2 uncharacterized protein Dwil_GK16268 [Drosophila willistoni]
MTSGWVLLIASILHFGLRGSCFLNIDRFPMVPGTIYAGHIAYCAILHFLYDTEVLPERYKRRMNLLASFLCELVLGVAIMEVLALWLWCSVEHIVHMTLQCVLKRYLGMPPDLYQQWEYAIMGGVMTTLAIFLWINAYEATDPNGKQPIVMTKSEEEIITTKEQNAKKKQLKKTPMKMEFDQDTPEDQHPKCMTEAQ